MASPQAHQTANAGARSNSTPGTTELLEELTDGISGIGLVTMSFLAAIPGFLPAVLLAALLVAVVLIPMLVVGAALGVLVGLVLLATRVVRAALRETRRGEAARLRARPRGETSTASRDASATLAGEGAQASISTTPVKP